MCTFDHLVSFVLYLINYLFQFNDHIPPIDPAEAILVVFSFPCILLLIVTLIFLSRVDKGAPSSTRRECLEFLLWAEATLLAVLFSWQAADAVASTSASVLIWGTTGVSSCYFLNELVSTKASTQMISK